MFAKIMKLPIEENGTINYKVLVRIAIVMIVIIQVLGGFVIKNIYDRFVALEQESIRFDQEIEELKVDIKILETHEQDFLLLHNHREPQ